MPSEGYRLEIKRSAQKDLDGLQESVFDRIDAKILALADDRRPPGCKKLKAFESTWRIRVGDYRVLYEIDDKDRKVTVVGVPQRDKAY